MRSFVRCVGITLVFVATAFRLSLAANQNCQNSINKTTPSVPFVTPETWLPPNAADGQELKDVVVCCRHEVAADEESCTATDATSNDDDTKKKDDSVLYQKVTIGQMPQFTTDRALQVLDTAVHSWNGGAGVWPQRSLEERCRAVQQALDKWLERREEMVHILMWEIGKNFKDAQAEIDRTADFVRQVLQAVQQSEFKGAWQSVGSTRAFVKRSGVGVILCLAPYNYPINEAYAAMIPALLMGNIILLKIPTVGGLAHLLTMQAFAETLPPGTMNFIAGGGRVTMPPIMKTGKIDGLAFIGGSKAADNLIHSHPHPHRLSVFLQLEAKNMGIVLPDVFSDDNADDDETQNEKKKLLEHTLDEAVLGSLSFNGQRCTALKLFFVPTAHAQSFAEQLATRVEALSVGLPWETFGDNDDPKQYAQITPLPNDQRVAYMKELLDDAVAKGARIMNNKGGQILGGDQSTLMVPAVLYPVTPDMRIYTEEQFGPLVPVAAYDSLETVLEYGQHGEYAQQVSIFTKQADGAASTLLDRFSSVFGKINLNSQCGRSPDTIPFAGRRSSAMGVMSVTDALREFSVPTVVAYKDQPHLPNTALAEGLQQESVFLQQ